MSDPNPNAAGARARAGNSSRYLFLLLLGLVIGVVATVMAMRALDARKDHFPRSVMQVQQWHVAKLKANMQQNRCGATDTLPHLQTLRVMANDLEPGFSDLSDDQRFIAHSSQMRSTLDDALSSPPLNCAGLESTLENVGQACQGCHQDFRD